METSKKQELFQKYVSGQSTQEEVDLLMRLIDEGGTDDLGKQAEMLWSTSHLFPPLEEGAGNRIRSRVMQSVDAGEKHDIKQARREIPYWVRVAAVLFPFVVFSFVFYWGNKDETPLATTPKVGTIAYIEKANPKGQKSTIILSDGSVVTLNADSKLIYKERFDDKERRVILEGEAFFDVSKDASRPFIIETKQITTRVLGTSFNIRAYPGADEVKVAVASGKVSIKKSYLGSTDEEERALVLVPGEMGVYKKLNQTLNKTSFDKRDLFGWKEGLIYFKNANFIDVQERLEQWYGVNIIIEKPISLEKDFSGTYKNKPLELVLQGLAFVYDFNYEIKDKVVRIY